MSKVGGIKGPIQTLNKTLADLIVEVTQAAKTQSAGKREADLWSLALGGTTAAVESAVAARLLQLNEEEENRSSKEQENKPVQEQEKDLQVDTADTGSVAVAVISTTTANKASMAPVKTLAEESSDLPQGPAVLSGAALAAAHKLGLVDETATKDSELELEREYVSVLHALVMLTVLTKLPDAQGVALAEALKGDAQDHQDVLRANASPEDLAYTNLVKGLFDLAEGTDAVVLDVAPAEASGADGSRRAMVKITATILSQKEHARVVGSSAERNAIASTLFAFFRSELLGRYQHVLIPAASFTQRCVLEHERQAFRFQHLLWATNTFEENDKDLKGFLSFVEFVQAIAPIEELLPGAPNGPVPDTMARDRYEQMLYTRGSSTLDFSGYHQLTEELWKLTEEPLRNLIAAQTENTGGDIITRLDEGDNS